MEGIMKQAGSCGRFQVIQIWCICLARCVCFWGAFAMIFGNYNPGWRCVNPRTHDQTILFSTFSQTNDSIGQRMLNSNSSIPKFSTLARNKKTNIDRASDLAGVEKTNFSDVGDMKNPIDVTHDEYDGTCDVINSCVEGIEFNPESSTIISEFGLVCDREWIATVILVVSNAGFVVGSAIFGQVSERYGRKMALYGSAMIVTLTSGAAIFSPNWQTYTCLLFFMVIGSQGALTASVVFIAEFLNSKWRGFTASCPVMSFSLCSLSVLMLLLKEWRYLHITTCVMCFVACLGFFFVQESPRWLLVNSQTTKADKVMQKIAKRNGKKPIEIATIQTLFESSPHNETQQKRSFSYLDLFRSKEYRILTLKTGVNFTLNILIYRALSFGLKSVPGNFYHNAIVSSVLQAAVLLTAGPISNLIGRRRSGFLFSFLGSTSCSIIVLALFVTEDYTQETIIKIFAYIARAVTMAAVGTNLLFVNEIFPTAIRNVAVGFNNTLSSTVALLCAFVIPRDDDVVSFAVCYSLMAACCVVNILLFWSYPETNKTSLKDSLVSQSKATKTDTECASASLNCDPDSLEQTNSVVCKELKS